MSATHALGPGEAFPAGGGRGQISRGDVWHVYRAERRKLSSQLATRLLALICVLGPFAFAGVLKLQSGSPADTLFGVWVHQSGFALSLVVLSFCGSWGFPVLAGVLAGDIFASEDRYGTWKMVLTRSSTRRALFAGKLLAAATFSIGLLLLLMVSSLAAGLLLIGDGSLVDLGGRILSTGHSLELVVASWLLNILPMLAFTSIAVLLSVATRNGIMGVIGPALVALVMQLLLLVGSGVWLHMLLASSAFDGWYTLFVDHQYYGPLAIACIVSVVWIVACLAGSWLILRRRDFAGTPVSRRPGWVVPVRVAVGSAAVVAFLAIATNWGPAGDTAARLKASIMPAFNNLTLLQQRELGRDGPPRGEAERAHELQPARQHPVGARRLDLHARRVHPAAGGRAVPGNAGQLRRQPPVGRLLQGRVAAVVRGSADDEGRRRAPGRQPAVRDLRLLQPVVASSSPCPLSTASSSRFLSRPPV